MPRSSDSETSSDDEPVISKANKKVNMKGSPHSLKRVGSNSKFKLHWAAERSDIDLATRLMDDQKITVDTRNATGGTPLMLAAMQGNHKMVEFLISRGADVNAVNSQNYTPLVVAADLGPDDTSVSQLLLEHGAKFGENSSHALFSCVIHRKIKLASFLFEKKLLDPNVRGNKNNTPLIMAAGLGDSEMVALLLENGADVNAVNDEKNTALLTATEFEFEEIIESLLTHKADVNVANSEGETPLYIAVRNENFEITKKLIDAGADPNIGPSALLVSTKENHSDISRALLEAGSNPNVVNEEDKSTPLHYAANFGNDEIITTLMKEKKVNVNLKNTSGFTPLIIATSQGYLSTVQLLVEKFEANFSETDNEGRTALHHSVGFERPEIAKYLLKKGADHLAEDNDGCSPMDIAEDYSQSMLPIFEKHNAMLLTLNSQFSCIV